MENAASGELSQTYGFIPIQKHQVPGVQMHQYISYVSVQGAWFESDFTLRFRYLEDGIVWLVLIRQNYLVFAQWNIRFGNVLIINQPDL